MAWDFENRPELPNSQMDIYYFSSPHKQITEDFHCDVIRVTDGDTIQVKWEERDFDFPIRFLDIDAPEMNEERGQKVKDWLANRILNQEVQIRIDKRNRVDKWGRLLGRIFHRGMDTGNEMMNLGLVTKFEARNEGKIPNTNKLMNIAKWF